MEHVEQEDGGIFVTKLSGWRYGLSVAAIFILMLAVGALCIWFVFGAVDPRLRGAPFLVAVGHLVMFQGLETLLTRLKRFSWIPQVALHLLALAVALGLAFVVER